jgi:hypothetical protein
LCKKVIRSQERNQPVTEWAPELLLSFHLIEEAPNRSAGGGNESIPLNFSFEELRGPALRFGGSLIFSQINDAYSATWVSLNNLFFRFCGSENSFIRTNATGR